LSKGKGDRGKAVRVTKKAQGSKSYTGEEGTVKASVKKKLNERRDWRGVKTQNQSKRRKGYRSL